MTQHQLPVSSRDRRDPQSRLTGTGQSPSGEAARPTTVLGHSVAHHLSEGKRGRMVSVVAKGMVWAGGALTVGLLLTGCTSGSASSTTTSSTTPSATTTPGTTASTAAVPTTAAATTSAATCPTLAQANAALGGSYSGPNSTSTAGGIVCEYTGGAGTAGVTIFAHQSATVFTGQVAHAPGAPAMPSVSGVGDGAFGMTTAGRSIVNAYSDGTRTLVAAQGPGALAPVEALAKIALADN
jgi:hypothetical protein